MVLRGQGDNGTTRPRLGEAQLAELSRLGQHRALSRGQSIFLAGEAGGSALLVKSGRVKLSRVTSEGRELILSFLDAGDLLLSPGERIFKGSEPLIEALSDALLLFVPLHDFEAFLRARPAAATTVIRQLAGQIRALDERIEEMAFKDVQGRLATVLLRLAGAYGSREPAGGTVVGIRITQQELANLIGASREMVNHTLAHWKREGLIELNGRSIVIRRTEELASLGSAR